MFFVKTQRTPTQTDTTILSVYSLSLVTIITGHLILTKKKVTVLGKRQLCVVKCKRKDLLSTSIVEKLHFLKKLQLFSADGFYNFVLKKEVRLLNLYHLG
jgi:hypothetical protein